MVEEIRAFRTQWWTQLLVATLANALTGVALAAECGPLKQVTSVDLTPLSNGLRLVPVTINGTSKRNAVRDGGRHFQSDGKHRDGARASSSEHPRRTALGP